MSAVGFGKDGQAEIREENGASFIDKDIGLPSYAGELEYERLKTAVKYSLRASLHALCLLREGNPSLKLFHTAKANTSVEYC